MGGLYSPGSTLTGSLTIEVEGPREFKTIRVYVIGQGHVQWLERRSTTDINGQSQSEVRQYKSDEVYVSLQQMLWKCEDSPDGVLPLGIHTYGFQIPLPVTCPGSFTGSETGSITYQIDGIVATGVPNLEYRVSQSFSVVEVVTFAPGLGEQPVHIENRRKVRSGLFKSGNVVYRAELPKTRFNVGEEIPLSWCVENGSDKPVTPLFSLVENITYIAQGSTRSGQNSITSLGSTAISPRKSSGDVSIRIPIPAHRPAMTRSNIIRSSVSLVMTLLIPGAFASNIVTPVPLYISNISIPQQQQQQAQKV